MENLFDGDWDYDCEPIEIPSNKEPYNSNKWPAEHTHIVPELDGDLSKIGYWVFKGDADACTFCTDANEQGYFPID